MWSNYILPSFIVQVHNDDIVHMSSMKNSARSVNNWHIKNVDFLAPERWYKDLLQQQTIGDARKDLLQTNEK